MYLCGKMKSYVSIACVCLPVSSDEAECFNDAYTKNETHFKTPCNGVDFLSLQRGDVREKHAQ